MPKHRPRNEVWYDGKIITVLNKDLIKRQKITDRVLETLKQTHIFKHIIFNMAKELDDKTQTEQIKALAKVYENIEFELQRLWGFEQNKHYHRFWEFPKCRCPHMDNEDRIGHESNVHVSSCPVHGFEVSH